jgi:hypothetical protein
MNRIFRTEAGTTLLLVTQLPQERRYAAADGCGGCACANAEHQSDLYTFCRVQGACKHNRREDCEPIYVHDTPENRVRLTIEMMAGDDT